MTGTKQNNLLLWQRVIVDKKTGHSETHAIRTHHPQYNTTETIRTTTASIRKKNKVPGKKVKAINPKNYYQRFDHPHKNIYTRQDYDSDTSPTH
jgi:hypothetical protein